MKEESERWGETRWTGRINDQQDNAAPEVGLRTLVSLMAGLLPGQVLALLSQAPESAPEEQWHLYVGNCGENGWLVDLPVPRQPQKITFAGQMLLRRAGFSTPTDDTSDGFAGSYLLHFDFDDIPAVARIILAVHEHVMYLPHPWLFSQVEGLSFLDGVPAPCLHAVEHHLWAA